MTRAARLPASGRSQHHRAREGRLRDPRAEPWRQARRFRRGHQLIERQAAVEDGRHVVVPDRAVELLLRALPAVEWLAPVTMSRGASTSSSSREPAMAKRAARNRLRFPPRCRRPGAVGSVASASRAPSMSLRWISSRTRRNDAVAKAGDVRGTAAAAAMSAGASACDGGDRPQRRDQRGVRTGSAAIARWPASARRCCVSTIHVGELVARVVSARSSGGAPDGVSPSATSISQV